MVLRANNPSRQGSSRDVTIGRLRAVYAKPPGDGPFAGVIVVHDALGLGQDMRGMVDQFTRAGYAAVAPDLYSDGARPLCVARTLVDTAVSYTHLRAHETVLDVVCRLLLEKKKKHNTT